MQFSARRNFNNNYRETGMILYPLVQLFKPDAIALCELWNNSHVLITSLLGSTMLREDTLFRSYLETILYFVEMKKK